MKETEQILPKKFLSNPGINYIISLKEINTAWFSRAIQLLRGHQKY
jgi:hypothetical protein